LTPKAFREKEPTRTPIASRGTRILETLRMTTTPGRDQHEQRGRELLRTRVDLACLHDGALPPLASWQDGATYLGPAVDSLLRALERTTKTGESLSASKVFMTRLQSECTLHVQSGWRLGAAVNLLWRPEQPSIAVIRVLVYSRAQKWLTWSGFASGVAATLAGVHLALPADWNAKVRFLLGLVGGAFVGFGLTLVVDRLDLGRDMPGSEKIAKRLAGAVRKWLARHGAIVDDSTAVSADRGGH